MVRYHIRSTTPDKRRRSSRGARLREQPYKRSPGRSSQGAKAPSIETARVRELDGQGLTEIAKAQAKRYYGGEGKASEPAEFDKEGEAASAFSDREGAASLRHRQGEGGQRLDLSCYYLARL